jgi:hypothetical protein
MNIPGLTNHALIALQQLIGEAQAADDAAAVAQRRRPSQSLASPFSNQLKAI